MRFRTAAVAVVAFALGLTLGVVSHASAENPDPGFRIFTRPGEKIPAPPPPVRTLPVTAQTEIGLRIQGRHQGRVVGTLVARVDGKWVEVQLAPQDTLINNRP